MVSNLASARQQIQRIRQLLEPVKRIQTFGCPENGMPTIAMGVSGLSSAEVASHLARQRIVVGSGVHCAPLAHEALGTLESGLVRLSVGVGQSDQEVDEAIDRMQSVFNDESFLAPLNGQ